MLILISTTVNPYFNLATEEYLFKNKRDNLIFLYRNSPSLIVGKHQNTLAEINLPFVLKYQIPVIRRLSGGGTVYHDEGNINFCFIKNGTEGHLVNFKEFTLPVVRFLKSLGIDAELGSKNELSTLGLKFSGNAEHLFKNRIMHHGTLLFNTNLDQLDESIRVNPQSYLDKAVKSNRMRVTNLLPLLTTPVTAIQFMEDLTSYFGSYFPDSQSISLSQQETESIEALVQSKYNNKDWNFGYSPSYQFSKDTLIGNTRCTIHLKAEKSIIIELNLVIHGFESDSNRINAQLLNSAHDFEEIDRKLRELPALDCWKRFCQNDLTQLFF
jgi:lipoate---protein ligase